MSDYTLAIISTDPKRMNDVHRLMVHFDTLRYKLTKDQEHYTVVKPGFPFKSSAVTPSQRESDLLNFYKRCIDIARYWGATFFVFIDDGITEDLSCKLENYTSFQMLKLSAVRVDDAAKEEFTEYAPLVKDSIKNHYPDEVAFTVQLCKMFDILYRYRLAAIKTSVLRPSIACLAAPPITNETRDLPFHPFILKYVQDYHMPIIYGVGGAGPAASCEGDCAVVRATEQGGEGEGRPIEVVYLGICASHAPGKNDALMGLGETFEPHYRHICRLITQTLWPVFNLLDHHPSLEVERAIRRSSVLMFCNTVHLVLDKLYPELQWGNKPGQTIPLTSILDATVRYLQQYIKLAPQSIVLLGTPATINQNLYDKILKSNGYPPLIPSVLQQTAIWQAIQHIKGGRIEKAKELIVGVISDIRFAAEGNRPVLLACTELNLIGTPKMLGAFNCFATTIALALSHTYPVVLQRETVSEPSSQGSEPSSDDDIGSDVTMRDDSLNVVIRDILQCYVIQYQHTHVIIPGQTTSSSVYKIYLTAPPFGTSVSTPSSSPTEKEAGPNGVQACASAPPALMRTYSSPASVPQGDGNFTFTARVRKERTSNAPVPLNQPCSTAPKELLSYLCNLKMFFLGEGMGERCWVVDSGTPHIEVRQRDGKLTEWLEKHATAVALSPSGSPPSYVEALSRRALSQQPEPTVPMQQ